MVAQLVKGRLEIQRYLVEITKLFVHFLIKFKLKTANEKISKVKYDYQRQLFVIVSLTRHPLASKP